MSNKLHVLWMLTVLAAAALLADVYSDATIRPHDLTSAYGWDITSGGFLVVWMYLAYKVWKSRR